MCSKHDDPSQIEVLVKEMDAEEAYAMRFYGSHQAWMEDNDPNTWAWLLPRKVRGEKYSEAVNGANKMRKSAFHKMLRDLPKYSDEYIILHASGTAANKEIEFGIPTFKQNFFGLNK
jgi:hypothetical protein